MAAKKKAKRVVSGSDRAKSAGASKKAAAARAPRAAKKATPAARRPPSAGAKPAAKRAQPAVERSAQKVDRVRPTSGKPLAVAAQASANEIVAPVSSGDAAPSFDLPDETGARVSSRQLAGRPYALYFYPKDDTPGCTTEACGFRDALPEFEKLGVRIIGVSPDSPASHERFRGKYELPFTLLSDAEKQLSTAYGAWALKKNYGREYMGVVRSTFLIDSHGVIRNVWRGVKVNGHVEKVQAAAAALG
jgi:peroxiredoxin Q/BCP